MEFNPQLKLALLSQSNTTQGQSAISLLLTSMAMSVGKSSSSPVRFGYLASEPDPERQFYNETREMYLALGVELDCYLDLEDGFSPEGLTRLFSCDGIHLSGGDTYRFLKGLKARYLLEPLREYAFAGGILVGLSAGAMIMTPSIQSAPLCGDSNDVGLIDLSGLNLVPFLFVPHAPKILGQSLAEGNSEHEDIEQEQSKQESEPLNSLMTAAKELAVTHDVYLCSDEQALVICDAKLLLVSSPLLLSSAR